MTDAVLLQERREAVVLLTLNRPAKLNALDLALTEALVDALEAADGDQSVRVTVVTGAGRAFCAGADIREFRDRSDDEAKAQAERRSALFVRLNRMIPDLAKPVIAAVNGPALGGGCALAIGCDMAIADEAATFGYPEVGFGVVPAGIMPPLLHRAGARATFDLIATGRTIEAAEALRLGLINRVVPAGSAVEDALAKATLLAGHSPDAVSEIKALVGRIAGLSLAEGLDYIRGRQQPDED